MSPTKTLNMSLRKLIKKLENSQSKTVLFLRFYANCIPLTKIDFRLGGEKCIMNTPVLHNEAQQLAAVCTFLKPNLGSNKIKKCLISHAKHTIYRSF